MSVFGRKSAQERNISAAILSDMGPGMHPRISIRGGSFALVDAAGMRYGAPVFLRSTPKGQVVTMLGVIIGSNPKKSRVFYGSKYDPDNPGPPDCFSDNGLAPSSNSSEPQARTCAECEWSKWGSDRSQLTGKKTKACDEKKKIAIMVVGDTAGLSYELQIPPATLKTMAVYAATLAQGSPPGESRKADMSDMVTAFSFAPDKTGLLEFEPFAWLTSSYIDRNGTLCVATDAGMAPLQSPDGGESVGERIDDIWESHELDDLLGLNDRPWTPPALAGPLPGMSGYLESQPHGGALQRGLPAQHEAVRVAPPNPYAPPNLAAQPAQPTQPYSPPVAHHAPHPPGPQPAAQQPVTTAAPAPTQRRRRTPAAGTARQDLPAGSPLASSPFPAQGQVEQRGGAPAGDEIPNFLRRSAGPQPATQAGTGVLPRAGAAPDQNQNGGAAYGMVEAGAPPSAIENVLDAAFKLNTTRT